MSGDVVVLSHLRWTWVWQRPQHLISRIRGDRPAWFVEQPLATGAPEAMLRHELRDGIRRVWREVPGSREFIYFDDPEGVGYVDEVRRLVGESSPRLVWLYTPLGLPYAEALNPSLIVYDVMDDLAAFAKAPPSMKAAQAAALDRADVVFTGGRSLHAAVARTRAHDLWLFPSGVDVQHYLPARAARRERARPVAGYVGVIDERLDLRLLSEVADALADWQIVMVGPIYKIDESDVPRADNITYLGPQTYEELPAVMAGLDVALMPFALNEATRSISPTKTLEYLAAGLPVVSTPVADVVADCGDVVAIASDAAAFADACRASRGRQIADEPRVARLLSDRSWDVIAAQMTSIIDRRMPG